MTTTLSTPGPLGVTAPGVISAGRGQFLTHSYLLMLSALRTLSRQPMYLAFTLIQPIVWLLLFGQLFKRISELPGFGTASYLDYLTPGVVAMTAIFSAGWAGTSFIQEMDRGVMDRNLTSPLKRGALIAGSLAYQAVTTVIQSAIVIGIGVLSGARVPGGPLGVLVVIVAAILLALIFAALSDAVALLVRQQEALIGISQFLTMPLTFLSSVLMAPSLMPGWVADVARFNPVDWAAVSGREALSAGPDWSLVGRDLGFLLLLAVVMGWLATRAFGSYQRAA
jgi:ABC-2 type transport system permease protein